LKTLTPFLSILICTLAICLGPSYLHAAEYFVDANNGSDSNPGTLRAPWKKIAKANNTLKAGDTVYIRAGSYAETIRPTNSGKPDNYITYTTYNGEDVTIGGSITHGADLSDRSWIKIDGLNFTDTLKYWIQFWSNGSYNYIVNCDFKATGSSMGWAGLMIGDRADYNKIINNTFSSACKPDDLVDIYSGSYNLIENNYFGTCAHTALAIQDHGPAAEYNIIRNNTFQNYFHHNIGIYQGPQNTLIEKNLIYDAGGDCDAEGCPKNTCGSDRDRSMPRDAHSGLKISGEKCIVRNNVLVNNGRFALESWSSSIKAVENYIYNNTMNENIHGWNTESNSDSPFHDNVAKNNIFSDNVEYNFKFGAAVKDTSNLFINNRFHGKATVAYKYRTDVDNIQSLYSKEWIDNSMIENGEELGFKNAGQRDLNLRGDSILIDKGSWLTVITSSSGSGSTFTVADAGYFSDGFGVIQGDSIQIEGQKSIIRIKSVDYSAHKIVVDRSVSWNKGDGISLPYTGNSPDIGAFEYNSLVPPALYIVKQ
jgi:hypothetical protein